LLINHDTASSAEIVAGALNAHQRATLVGTPTHSKASIQFIFELADGSSVHIPSNRWWIDELSFLLASDIEVMDNSGGEEVLKIVIQVFNSEFIHRPNQLWLVIIL
jgi:carboxyl-terminal processing protease